MRINHNIASLNTYRQLSANSVNTQKSLEKLSSGLRINKAGDDAAGLAISEKMRSQIRGLDQASRNAQDGISLIQTAEGALNESHSILQRMRELAVQSSNDTNVTTDRDAIQNEMDQLVGEIDRIGNTTEFNTQKLLNGNVSETSIRKSFSTISYSGQTTFNNVKIDTASNIATGDYTLKVVSDTKVLNGMSDEMHTIGVDDVNVGADTALGEGQYFVQVSTTRTAAMVADTSAYAASTASTVLTNNTLLMDGTITIESTAGSNTVDVTFRAIGGTASTTISLTLTTASQTLAADFGSAVGTVDIALGAAGSTATTVTTGTWVGNVDVTNKATLVDSAGTTIGTAVAVNNGDADVKIGQSSTGKTVTVDFGASLLEGEASFGVKATGVASAVIVNSASTTLGSKLISANTDRIDFGEITVGGSSIETGISFAVKTITNGQNVSLTVNRTVSDSSLAFQIGSNAQQSMNLSIEDMRSNALGVDGIDVTTRTKAVGAIDTIDTAIQTVSEQRSALGAIQNRLDHTIANLGTSSENLTAAESRVRDVDMAKEMMEFTKNNILTQAAQAMLAQANQQPQGVLQLLR